jgi:hypothetical protein
MKGMVGMIRRCWRKGIVVVGLSLLWSFGMPAVTNAQAPSAICVLKINTNGKVLSILVDAPQNFNVALPLPLHTNLNVPILCESLSSLALAAANNEAYPVTFNTQVFTHEGVLFCIKGEFEVPVDGGRGVTFADCL